MEMNGNDAEIQTPSHLIQQQYMFTESPPDEHQLLLRTLTRLDVVSERLLQAENDVERDLDQLIALKNREELEELYGTPVIVTFIFSLFFSPPAFI